MSHAFGDLAFTPAVKAAQQQDGSRASYARNFESTVETFNDKLGEAESEFIRAQRSFFLATVSETGWPYVQHRGGPVSFLKVLDEKTLALDWNCPQHIPQRIEAEDVQKALAERDARIATLEAQLAQRGLSPG